METNIIDLTLMETMVFDSSKRK